MAERNEEVMRRVRAALAQHPDAGSTELFEMAKEVDPSLRSAGVRSFHARYVLPVRRTSGARKGARKATKRGARKSAARKRSARTTAAKTPGRKRGRPPKQPGRKRGRPRKQQATAGSASRAAPSSGDPDRAGIRAAFLEFAREVAAAETRMELVEAVGDVDRYVDRVITAIR